MRSTCLLLPSLLSPDAARIGSLIIDPRSPHMQFHIPDQRVVTKFDLVETESTSVEQLLSQVTQTDISAALKKVFSTKLSSHRQSDLSMAAVLVRKRQLKNSTDFFTDICKSKKTRLWLELNAIGKKRPAYLVVGLCLATDAKVDLSQEEEKEVDLHGQVPVASATGGVGGDINPSVDITHKHHNRGSLKYNTEGEQVYAVEYRKITFGWLWSGDMDKAKIEEGSRWKVYTRGRGLAKGDVQKKDVVEAILESDTESNDLCDTSLETEFDDWVLCAEKSDVTEASD